MSESVESPAPTSTADIAASVIESAEQADASPVEVGAESTAAEVATETTAAAPAVVHELSEEEKLLHELGYKHAYKPDGREHYIPRSKVLQMIGTGLKRGQERWTTERTTIEGEAKTLREQNEQLSALGELMQRDPRAFLELVATHDERYKPFLTPAEAARHETPADDPMPQPDLDLGDGRKTFSLDGLQKLREWDKRQTIREMEAKLDARLKPLTEREKQIEVERKVEAENTARRERTGKLLAEAQSWPLFGQLAADGTYTPFQQEVLDALRADKSPGTPAEALYRAYQKVALPRLMEDDNKKRERLLKEIGSAPKSPTVARTGGEPRKQGPLSTAEIAARVVQEAEAS